MDMKAADTGLWRHVSLNVGALVSFEVHAETYFMALSFEVHAKASTWF